MLTIGSGIQVLEKYTELLEKRLIIILIITCRATDWIPSPLVRAYNVHTINACTLADCRVIVHIILYAPREHAYRSP